MRETEEKSPDIGERLGNLRTAYFQTLYMRILINPYCLSHFLLDILLLGAKSIITDVMTLYVLLTTIK